MQQETTITTLQSGRDHAKQYATVITHLHNSSELAGTASLYKTLQKKFAVSIEASTKINFLPLDITLNRFVKRTIDIIFSLTVIITILPWLIPVMSILIKASSKGPVFFLQKRNKKNGAVFTCIKFRSMIVNEEADIIPAKQNDTRITFIGKFMRRTFIDEVPQFINVLWGDMSVIGPRPHMLTEHFKFEAYVPHYNIRQKIKPGITGLSQVMGLEGAVNTFSKMNDRVVVDNFYVRHWSVKLDLIIIFRTLCKMTHL